MSEAYNDDLFEGTKMTFGAHLEELRGVLFKSIFGLVIGMLIGLYFADKVVKFAQVPLQKALHEFYLNKAVEDMDAEFKGNASPELIATIVDAQLEPKREMWAAESLSAAVQIASPNAAIDLQFVRYRFVPDDVALDECGKLCEEIKSAERGEPGARLRQLITENDPATISRLAGKKKVTVKQRLELIAVLNELVEKREVHESKEFQDVKRTDEGEPGRTNKKVNELRNQLKTEFDPDVSRRLNRLLLSAAFPKQFRRPRVRLIEMIVWKLTKTRLQSLSAHESFVIWLKAGLIAGLVIASPWIFWQIWSFVAAGLYPHEKGFVYVFMPFSIVLFIGGACMAFFLVFKPVLGFLFSFNKTMNIDPDPRIGEWLSFVLILPLGFGVAFQLPLVMLFLNRLGIVKVETFAKKWRMAVLIIFVTSMFLTPADPISMLMMAGPLTVLYFLGILLSKWMPRLRRPMPEGYEPS